MSSSSAKRRVPVLQVHIPTPCQEDWSEMKGGAESRHCERCDHAVHDLSAMSRRDAQALLTRARAERGVCVRGYFRPDGTPVSYAELAQERRREHRRGLSRSAALLAAALSVAACADDPAAIDEPEHVTQALTPQADAAKPDAGNVALPLPEEVVPVMGEMAAPERPPLQHTMGKVAAPRPATSGQPGAKGDAGCHDGCDGKHEQAGMHTRLRPPDSAQMLMGEPAP